jgi:type II secretory ATPase GspE/PulE/Tfp pilus assembly ATPase PilB-like protein
MSLFLRGKRKYAVLPGFEVSEPVCFERFDVSRAIELSNFDALRALSPALVRTLVKDLEVDALANRICPVQRADNKVVLLALAADVAGDQADELARRLSASGYELAEPQRYVVSATMLMAIARGQALGAVAVLNSAVDGAYRTTTLAAAFQDMVEWGVVNQASDVHINIFLDAPESEVRFTIAGRYVMPERFCGISTANLMDMVAVAWMDIRAGNGAVFDPLAEQQGAMSRVVGGRRVLLRWASMAAERGPSVCLRLLLRDQIAPQNDLLKLGYLPDQVNQIERVATSEGGAILFAGSVGSGKSTTLATLMAAIPAHRKVMTLEDPVEYLIPRAVQSAIARDVDTLSGSRFATKLMALKRSAMTDVLLGEIRDLETGRAFVDLASSGVSVYSTTHAASALLAGERLASASVGVPRDFLATPGVLKMLVYQVLLPTLCRECALPATKIKTLPVAMLDLIQQLFEGSISALKFRNPNGCSNCINRHLPELSGYSGRTVAAHCLEPALTHGYYQALRSANYGTLQISQADGAFAIAMQKVFQGLVDPRDIETRFHAFETERRLRQMRRCNS